jgi:hypothetical protein
MIQKEEIERNRLSLACRTRQSSDALIACHSLVMIRYLLLGGYLEQAQIDGAGGPFVPAVGR